LKIVFMGTPAFACASLESLYNSGHDIVGVYTQPDKPRNRGGNVSYSPIKTIALERGSKVFQPDSFNSPQVIDELRMLQCDLIVVVAYGQLLPAEALEIPPLGCINIHASLLPKYRGAAPIQWAVIKGERETGVTAMYMARELDTGDVISSKKTYIGEEETAGELHDRLSVIGAELLIETINSITEGTAARMPQNHLEATYAPQLDRSISPIDWGDSAYNIKCKVRGLSPWPGATAVFSGSIFKIHSVAIAEKASGGHITEVGYTPGDIISYGNHGIEVACSDGSVIIKELQAAGGRRMTAAEYLRGHAL